ncbi:type 1 glutamine amidotransferase domain-containing protein [uncultured Winogradskyella sp.]|uniref:type 1 glutamine amidotransferase domain-containing protein n=1 Tax=uncultured Winogradskyella sp. TaxID=395353 RepID=UPI00351593B4
MKLESKNIAILATNGFEKSELFDPMNALRNEGANVDVVSTERDEIKSLDADGWGPALKVDKHILDVNEQDYNALVLPGGVMNPDTLRTDTSVLAFVKSFFESGKPVAAICHAPWLLISADVVENRKVTSFKSIKDDLVNAGANWLDQEVVVDHGLVTSRNPNDLPAFINKLIEEIREGKHEKQVVDA